jgi:hypothetical protein
MHPAEPLENLTWQDLRPILDEEIGRLPDKYRQPIILCYLEGKTHEQAADLERCWQALAGDDAEKAFDAIRNLCAAPKDAVAWITQRLKPTPLLDLKHIDDLIAQLDHNQFKMRQSANAELLNLGRQVLPALDKALAANPPLESKRRLEDLRGKLTGMILQGEQLRASRAVEVLEIMATTDARQVLQTLAQGGAGAVVTESAQAALKRLAYRP